MGTLASVSARRSCVCPRRLSWKLQRTSLAGCLCPSVASMTPANWTQPMRVSATGTLTSRATTNLLGKTRGHNEPAGNTCTKRSDRTPVGEPSAERNVGRRGAVLQRMDQHGPPATARGRERVYLYNAEPGKSAIFTKRSNQNSRWTLVTPHLANTWGPVSLGLSRGIAMRFRGPK